MADVFSGVPTTTAGQTIAEVRATLATALARYAAALASEAQSPLESYTLDGETTTPNEWREGLARIIASLTQQIADLDALDAQVNPYFVSTVQRY